MCRVFSRSCCCATTSGLTTGRRGPSAHRDWLAGIELGWPAAQATMLDTQGAIDALAHRRDQLEREIVALLPTSPWVTQTGRLRCLRGIDTLSAVGLCAEVGDFERFARAEQLMSYVGLVPSESTTGQQRRLGSITKTGSAHARRLLVEASWHYRKHPRIGKALAERHDDQPGRIQPGSRAVRMDRPGQQDHGENRSRPRAARGSPMNCQLISETLH